MRGPYFIIFFACLTFQILDAYPMDYDEKAANNTREALEYLRVMLLTPLQPVHEEFLAKKSVLLNETQEKLQNVYDTFKQYQQEIETYARSSNNTDINRCYEELEIISPDTFLDSLSATCDSPGDVVAFNLRRMEENKKGMYFYATYAELSETLEKCLDLRDPQPYICAGLVASTLQETQRIDSDIYFQPFQFTSEMNQRFIEFSECATGQLTVYSNRLNIWHSTFITCVEDLVNWIYK